MDRRNPFAKGVEIIRRSGATLSRSFVRWPADVDIVPVQSGKLLDISRHFFVLTDELGAEKRLEIYELPPPEADQ